MSQEKKRITIFCEKKNFLAKLTLFIKCFKTASPDQSA